MGQRCYRHEERDIGLKVAIEAAGGIRALARLIGIKHSAICQWARVPDHRLIEMEQALGIDRCRLRPDLYRRND